MAVTVDIGSLIERTPGVCGGRARIAGSRISVRTVAGWSNVGFSPEEIAAKYEHINLAQVHAALAHYFSNRSEIDAEIAEEMAIFEEAERHAPVK